MIHARDLYSSPPAARSKVQDNPTLLVSWWCTGFALAIIVVRLLGRLVRTERLFREDKIMALSIIPLCARMGLVHLVLIWGTNNAITDGLTPLEIQHREMGSRLVLASRIMYAMFLWIAKLTVCEFLKRLTDQVWRRSYEIGLQCIRWFLLITFAAVVIATLAECQPFDHYWQVVPDPGAMCRQGITQLITMGSTDVITDLVLVCFPIPIVLKSHMPLKRKLSLIFLFALSLILVGITVYRVIGTTDRHASQQFRSLLASLEILAAAAVSNAIVLGSFIRDRGAKKQRFRFGSNAGSNSVDRPPGPNTPKKTITNMDWGSDADLVGGLGMRCSPSLKEDRKDSLPRPAPIALPTSDQAKNLTPPPGGGARNWSFNRRGSSSSSPDLEKSAGAAAVDPPPVATRDFHPDPPTTPRGGMSFFDVGGLLIHHDPPRSPRPQPAPILRPLSSPRPPPSPRNFSYPSPLPSPRNTAMITLPPPPPQDTLPGAGPKKGSHALLQDIGGLIPEGGMERREGWEAASPSGSPTRGVRKGGRGGGEKMSLKDVLRDSSGEREREREREREPRYEPLRQGGGRATVGLKDVGGLLS